MRARVKEALQVPTGPLAAACLYTPGTNPEIGLLRTGEREFLYRSAWATVQTAGCQIQR